MALSVDEIRQRRRNRYLARVEEIKAVAREQYVPVAELSPAQIEERRQKSRKGHAKRKRRKLLERGLDPDAREKAKQARDEEIRERMRQYSIDYYAAKKQHLKEYYKRWREENRESERFKTVAKKFGIAVDDYLALMHRQNNLCAICGQPERSRHHRSGRIRNLAVDHDHKTGRVRGLLCSRCNLLLGRANEDVGMLRNAIRYLEQNTGKIDTALGANVPPTP